MAHPNEDLIRKGYDAFSRGDMEMLRGLFAEDIVWHTAGNNPTSGDHRGIDATLGSFAQILQLTGGTFSVELHDALANDEHGVALGVARGSREGKSLEQRYAQVFHIKDGKLTEAWTHNEDQNAVDDFLS